MASTVPSVQIVRGAEEFRAICNDARAKMPAAASGTRAVAFVPTMGALHDGHLALVAEARRRAAFVAVSIFVNPTQFGPNEDFTRYPRNLDRDVELLAPYGVNAVFAPEPDTVYPPGDETRVRVSALAAPLCGQFRPGHFEGVATVVTKLFALVGPSVAVFGRKDYQQLAIIRRLVRDLFLPVEVVGHPIVREADGLAMSSRNAYLSPEERNRALSLSRGLARAEAAFAGGERSASKLASIAAREIASAAERADRVDYVEVVDPDALSRFENDRIAGEPGRALLAVACHIGKTRLIDNMVLGEDPPPSKDIGPKEA
jgi:pantoate--beta-alanine ligase